MIYINKDQMKQVEYILEQSRIGNHVLFDLTDIREVFETECQDPLSESEMYGVEQHIERLISLPTLAQKKAFLERLDCRTFRLIVKTYFNIVENSFEGRAETHH